MFRRFKPTSSSSADRREQVVADGVADDDACTLSSRNDRHGARRDGARRGAHQQSDIVRAQACSDARLLISGELLDSRESASALTASPLRAAQVEAGRDLCLRSPDTQWSANR